MLTKDLLDDSLLDGLSHLQISQLTEALDKICPMEGSDFVESLRMWKLDMTVRQLESCAEATLNLLLSRRFTLVSFEA